MNKIAQPPVVQQSKRQRFGSLMWIALFASACERYRPDRRAASGRRRAIGASYCYSHCHGTQFDGNCSLLFTCSLQSPQVATLPSAPIIITPTGEFTATFFIANDVVTDTSKFGDLANLSVTVAGESRFATQQRESTYYILQVSMPDLPVGQSQVNITFAMTTIATGIRYVFADNATFRVLAKVTTTPTPSATPLPTLTPTLMPTLVPSPTSTTFPNARPLYLPVLLADPCGAVGPDGCDEPNSLGNPSPRLQVGRVISAQLTAATDVEDGYRIVVPDGLTHTVEISPVTATAGVDLDLFVYASNTNDLLCRSNFTGRNNERIRFNVLPCSESSAYTTTRLPAGTYRIRVFGAALPAGTTIPYTIALRRDP